MPSNPTPWKIALCACLLVLQDIVSQDAPNYWLKRLMPPFEFGLMHALLLQMALLPLTMCKTLLAGLSSRFPHALPFEHMTQFHIHVGYTFCGLMLVATVPFVAFLWKVCGDHLQGLDPMDACAMLTSEIMITGWVIFGLVLVVVVSSYFRQHLPFEWFMTLHYFVLAVYAVTVGVLWHVHCTVLYCTVLYCTVLYCTVLYCTVLYCIVLYCTVLYCTVLYCPLLCCAVLCCAVLCCATLHCTALCCAVLHCSAVPHRVMYPTVMSHAT